MEAWLIVLGIGFVVATVGWMLFWLDARYEAELEHEFELGLYYSSNAAELMDLAKELPQVPVEPTYTDQYGDVRYAGVLR